MTEEKTTVGYEPEKRYTGFKIAFVLTSLFAGFVTATQHFAYSARYHESLGPHVGNVYFPGMIVAWVSKWGEAYAEQLKTSIAYGMLVSAVSLLCFLVLGRIVTMSARGNAGLHGTAHWATEKEVAQSGLLDSDEGVYVGAWEDAKGVVHYLRDNGPSHVLCFAPTRSGKGVGLVLPTCLSWKHSTVVSDLKGELWQLTSGWRQKYADNIVLRFEPGAAEGCARWNPLDEIRMGTADETGDIRNLTETIIDPKGKGLDDFWLASAANLLEAILTHVKYKGEREGIPANMEQVAYFLNDACQM